MSEQHDTKSNKEDDCCSVDTNSNTSPAKHTDDDGHNHNQIDSNSEEASGWKSHWQLLLSH